MSSAAATPLFRAWLRDAVNLPPDSLTGQTETETMVSHGKYTIELASLQGAAYVVITNPKSKLTTHVPMSNVRHFDLMTAAHQEYLTAPKRDIMRGLVRKLG